MPGCVDLCSTGRECTQAASEQLGAVPQCPRVAWRTALHMHTPLPRCRNGNAHLYSKNLTDAQVAELLQKTASMTWVQQPSIDASSGGAGLSAGAIAGIVVGCTAIAVILVAAVLVLRRRQKHPVSDAEATQRVLKVGTLAAVCARAPSRIPRATWWGKPCCPPPRRASFTLAS